MKEWKDFKEREDLRMIPIMATHGFRVIYNPLDASHNRTSPRNVPLYAVSFGKRGVMVWKSASGWRSADIDAGIYRNHETHETLDDFIRWYNEKQ